MDLRVDFARIELVALVVAERFIGLDSNQQDHYYQRIVLVK